MHNVIMDFIMDLKQNFGIRRSTVACCWSNDWHQTPKMEEKLHDTMIKRTIEKKIRITQRLSPDVHSKRVESAVY